MREYEHPSKVLLLQFNEGLFSSDKIAGMLENYGLYTSNGNSLNPGKDRAAYLEAFFLREIHMTQRMVKWVLGIDDFTVSALGGEMVLPLFGVPLACDYRIVSDDFVLINKTNESVFSPMGGLPWFLTRILGRSQTWKLLTGKTEVHAKEALELGLVDQIVEKSMLAAESRRVADRIASLPWGCRVGLKRTMAAADEALDSYFRVEEDVFEKTVSRFGNTFNGNR
jgi:enoyl-CoA hydratase/carnithine racemase